MTEEVISLLPEAIQEKIKSACNGKLELPGEKEKELKIMELIDLHDEIVLDLKIPDNIPTALRDRLLYSCSMDEGCSISEIDHILTEILKFKDKFMCQKETFELYFSEENKEEVMPIFKAAEDHTLREKISFDSDDLGFYKKYAEIIGFPQYFQERLKPSVQALKEKEKEINDMSVVRKLWYSYIAEDDEHEDLKTKVCRNKKEICDLLICQYSKLGTSDVLGLNVSGCDSNVSNFEMETMKKLIQFNAEGIEKFEIYLNNKRKKEPIKLDSQLGECVANSTSLFVREDEKEGSNVGFSRNVSQEEILINEPTWKLGDGVAITTVPQEVSNKSYSKLPGQNNL